MQTLLEKFARKLVAAGLAPSNSPEQGGPLLAGLDDVLIWNIPHPEQNPRVAALAPLFDALSINSLVFTRPPEPYAAILGYLARQALREGGEDNALIMPQDCETRTFLHDLPVIRGLRTDALAQGLAKRKGVIVLDDQGPAVLAHGSVSPEQGFVAISSICFACFVKFFADALALTRATPPSPVPDDLQRAMALAAGHLPPHIVETPVLRHGPFTDEETVHLALIEAGSATVAHGLVDSYFGNISYLHEGVLYISQTGSSLDELAGRIDPCPLDGSSTAGLTASSELSAHLETLRRTDARGILHGHPPFCVILSLDCDQTHCPNKGRCHLDCKHPRRACGVPIVPGEVGTGPYGLCNTLPPALEKAPAAIVYGHGLFATARNDFNEAFATLLHTEQECRRACLERLHDVFPGLCLGQTQQGAL